MSRSRKSKRKSAVAMMVVGGFAATAAAVPSLVNPASAQNVPSAPSVATPSIGAVGGSEPRFQRTQPSTKPVVKAKPKLPKGTKARVPACW